MVVVPPPIIVTEPYDETVAIAVLLLEYVNGLY